MIKDLLRFFYIIHIFLKARLDSLLFEYSYSRWNLFLYLSPWRIFSSKKPRGDRLCKALEEAGPIFIKFGQLLSTRPDILPQDITKSLAKLRDNLEPFSTKEAIAIIERELDSDINEIFSTFEKTPIAAASIAQVYRAVLKKSGEVVAVKVVRPNIDKKIMQDISLMKRISKIIENKFTDARRLRLTDLVEEYEHVIKAELDMRIEASNMNQTKLNFKENKLLYVPEVYMELTNLNVLTMEKVSGIPVDQIEVLKNQGVNLKLLSERGVEIFLKQVFIDNFFHADMHPGNIFVEVRDKTSPTYVAVDYAIVGSLTEEEQFQIGRMLLSLMSRNFKEIASILIDIKWVDPKSNVNELERAIRVACEPVFQQPIEKIKFGELLLHIFESARRFNLNMQPSLMLLQKTLINIEGLGKQLYPKLDFWSIAEPFLKTWISERYNPDRIQEWAKKNAIHWIEKARKFPQMAETAMEQLSKLEKYQRTSEDRHRELVDKITKDTRKTNLSLILILVIILIFYTYIT